MLFKESLPSKFNPSQTTQFVPGRALGTAPDSDSILQPPQDIQTLWTRVIEHPETLTDHDRETILSRDPSTNDLYLQKCGLTLPALQDKAINTPEKLSQAECALIRNGVRDTKGQWDDPKNIIRWPRELKLLRLGAIENALSPRDRVAEKRAIKRLEGINESIFTARSRLDQGRDVMNLKKVASEVPWVEELMASCERMGGEVEWGFVGFRTGYGDDKAWEGFKERLRECTDAAVWLGKVPERMEGRWKVVWVEDRALEGMGLEGLCERFQSLCDAKGEDALPSSISRHAFLYADAQAIRSAKSATTITSKPPMKAPVSSSASSSAPAPSKEPLTNPGWIWAVDPSLTAKDRLASYKHSFKGSVKISLIHVLTTFYARLDPSANSDDLKGAKQAWDVVYAKAMLNQQEQGVYPPTAALN